MISRSKRIVGMMTAAALIAPAMVAPAYADGGAGIGNSETDNAIYKSQVLAMLNKRRFGGSMNTLDRLLAWHDVMLDANALDHTEASGVSGDQLGPTRNSRAFAITQIAVFDAINAFDRKFEAYSDGIPTPAENASRDAAIAQAAFTTLRALYPRQEERLRDELRADIRSITTGRDSIREGRAIGRAAARAILSARRNDGGGAPGTPEPEFGEGGRLADGGPTIFGEPVNNGERGVPRWTPDPTPVQDGITLPRDQRRVAVGANWGGVTPFVLRRGDQFRSANYPAPRTARFREAFEDVRREGSDPTTVADSTNTAEKQFIGDFWGYDGAPLLGTPPRLYAQLAVTVANSQGLKDVNEYARLLALVHTTMGDSGIAAWDSKYFHNFWRPVTGITRTGDGDPATASDPAWRPFGASVVNLTIPERFSPPFPAYPSGHATFGAATVQTLISYFGNRTRFTFVSDEYNGTGIDPKLPEGSQKRGFVPVRYRTLRQAQIENGRSRVFNGVHWEPDDTEGQRLGERITRFTLRNAFQRIGN